MSPTAAEPADAIFEHEDVDLASPPEEPRLALWEGLDGTFVTCAGILLPSLLIAITSVVCFERILRMVFKHPVETLLECAFIFLVPIANYYAWKAIRDEDGRRPFRIGLLNGASIATSFAIAGTIGASVFFNYPPNYLLLAFFAGLSGVASLYIGWRLRNSAGTRQGRTTRVLFSSLGVILSVAGLAACEAKGTAIRIAETMALSDVPSERDQGLNLLRQFKCEQDLRMQCADERTAGIPGMFWRISPEREREIYFAVTGKPYGNSLTESVYSMSDEYLRRHVVGSAVPGLNLLRSQMAGYVNSETLTSTLNWTFVFKNTTFQEQEARAEIAVPPGAVISDLTLWKDGTPHPAMIGPTDRAQQNITIHNKYTWVDLGSSDPALLTDLGRGRVLMQCKPVPAQGELKVQITFTSRLKPVALTQATMALPRFVDTNFGLTGNHNLRLHSAKTLSVAAEFKALHNQPAADGGSLMVGSLSEADLRGGNVNVSVSRDATVGPFVLPDETSDDSFIVEKIKQVKTAAPEHLVVVIDNSESMKPHLNSLIDALQRMPANVKTSIVLPTSGEQMEPVDLAKGVELIKNAKFDGGKDNLQAVIRAAEKAGETHRGAVLWVHGPQPSFNQEMYIMAPYIQRPNFYELALDDRWTDTNEFFKNHREIGPFVSIPRAGSVMEDLRSFLAKWKEGGTEFVVQLDQVRSVQGGKEIKGVAAAELTKLYLRDKSYDLMRQNRLVEATDLATAGRIVTPLTAAAVLHRVVNRVQPQNDAQQTAWLQGANNGTISPAQYEAHQQEVASAEIAPRLQGAANGTIGPQGADATVIAGVNTAGTVRVNNLANLEALLNVLANLGEIVGVMYGGFLLITAMINAHFDRPGKGSRMAVGAVCVTAGLFLPGCLNWLIASARDANLFS